MSRDILKALQVAGLAASERDDGDLLRALTRRILTPRTSPRQFAAANGPRRLAYLTVLTSGVKP